ncbi:MAG: dephospho-CoA kinase [Oscillatoriales cyanobacterium]|nr:MAG: dephospho-CoA kinase [Oscillatoriales cyanobacterium]
MRIIGLTGGIATGKTTLSDYLATRYGWPVLDADELARSAMEPGSPVLAAIAERFGSHLIREDGSLDRPRLGDIVFHDTAERQWLEAQIHPLVRAGLEAGITDRCHHESTLVLAVPLLFEANFTDLPSEIWVVTCDRSQQLARLMARSRLSVAEAEARIASQWPLAQKCDRADVVLQNTQSLDYLVTQVDRAAARSLH